ncbi:MAG: hypothetical protein KTR15_06775 [Phycisphaeraceae bacterium]|nr:hypothetical protein [Phycisphaeraceae bacterium]
MPYVDENQPKDPMNLPPILPFIALVAVMVVGISLYWVFYENLGLNQWLAPLLAGPLVGCALRFTAKQPIPRVGTIAIVTTVATCLIGYVLRHVLWIKWLDPTFKPSVGHAFEYLFSADMMAILLMAMSAYFAFAITSAIPRGNTKATQ